MGHDEDADRRRAFQNGKQAILDEKRDIYGLKAVTMAGTDGIDLYGNNIKETDYFEAAMRGERYVSDSVVTPDGKSAEFHNSAPLWAGGKKGTQIVGVVCHNNIIPLRAGCFYFYIVTIACCPDAKPLIALCLSVMLTAKNEDHCEVIV